MKRISETHYKHNCVFMQELLKCPLYRPCIQFSNFCFCRIHQEEASYSWKSIFDYFQNKQGRSFIKTKVCWGWKITDESLNMFLSFYHTASIHSHMEEIEGCIQNGWQRHTRWRVLRWPRQEPRNGYSYIRVTSGSRQCNLYPLVGLQSLPPFGPDSIIYRDTICWPLVLISIKDELLITLSS